MSGQDVRPDRHALLELDALLDKIEQLVIEGDRSRFNTDERYRWLLHRLWIAAGNEALAYARLVGSNYHKAQPWKRLYGLRNVLAHERLADIEEDEVWRMSALRPATVRKHLRTLLN